jgi:tRNA threonylcarbamoyladenosine biosynthesis protein TsaE
MKYESYTEKDTYRLGKQMGENAQKGQVYCLSGDLGVGKTVFTKGFAVGLGITEPISSPTFTIVQEYEQGELPLYHFDVYRIEDIEEMEEIGYEDYFYGNGVCLIEWAVRIKELLPKDYIQITIEKDLDKGFDYRIILVEENQS